MHCTSSQSRRIRHHTCRTGCPTGRHSSRKSGGNSCRQALSLPRPAQVGQDGQVGYGHGHDGHAGQVGQVGLRSVLMAVPSPGRSLPGRRADRHRHGGQEGLGKPCTRRRRKMGAEKKTGRLEGGTRCGFLKLAHISMNEGCQGKSFK